MDSLNNNLLFYILGGCTSRDIFRMAHISDDIICRYVARSSLISLMSSPLIANEALYTRIKNNLICCDFEKKSILGDFQKNLFQFNGLSNDYNYVFVIDLAEERTGVLKIGDCFITNSIHLRNSGIIPSLNVDKFIQASSEEWKTLWKCALDGFVHIIPQVLLKRCIIHKVYMADSFIDKNGLKQKFDDEEERIFIDWFNEFSDWLYHQISLKLPQAHIIEVAPENRIADANHSWGIHPGHFCEDYYLSAWKKIEECLELND